jgi:predicted metal-dependent HD superfamily phosphohydrolase
MDIVQKAESYVFNLFKDRLSSDYIYHNFNHTLRVVNMALTIAGKEDMNKEEREVITLGGWLHDTGYIYGPDEHEEKSAEIALAFLKENGYPEDKAQEVAALIRITKLGVEPHTHAEKIIKDADCSHFADEKYCELSELLREEWRLVPGKSFTDLEWATINRDVLIRKHRFHTDYAKKKLQPLKEHNIALIQESINELLKEEEKDKDKEEKKKKKEDKPEKPDRGIDTMFRVTLSNHTRLSDIADSKANILLSVNAIIISIALSTLIPKLDSPTNAHLVVPTFVMLMFSTVCIVFAILSTRPKVTTGFFTRKDIEDRKVNLLFFGNFYKMPLDEYDWAMNEMMKDRDYLYSSMIKDLYFLGKVLHRKYKLLRITYSIFMVGIVLSVIAFVYAFKNI